MKCIPLRWHIIGALMALALGTTLALTLVARHFLDLSLQSGVNQEMGQALTRALTIAKENYDTRKHQLQNVGETLMQIPTFQTALQNRDNQAIRTAFETHGIDHIDIKWVSSTTVPPSTSESLLVFKDPNVPNLLQLAIPYKQTNALQDVLLIIQPIDALIDIENAVHTFKHIEMEEADLRQAFVLTILFAAVVVVVLASLVGIRIGFNVTRPLYALIKGTREMARDNLEYRIPKGREDEIGVLIESFNRMAEDLKENRRKRLEAEQIAAWREIARRLAHEIKNPLTPIQLTVQQLRDKYNGNDPSYQKLVSDCTEIVTEEVENLRLLVKEFADFARMPSLALEMGNLNTTITDVIRLYPDARIKAELQPDLPELSLDSEQMRRVLINLIENGIDASEKKGQITIRTKTDTDTVWLTVSDTGPGVPIEERQRIFQPYVSTKESGMGLGLAVVRTIIDDHGGHISITDAIGGGAQFEIQLPIPEIAPRQPENQT